MEILTVPRPLKQKLGEDAVDSLVDLLNKSKAEIIKWMFIFWLGQIGAILGILFAFFRNR